MAEGANYDSVPSLRPLGSEVAMDNLPTVDLPPASRDLTMTLERGRPGTVECEDAAPDEPSVRPAFGLFEEAAATGDDSKPTRGFMNGVLLAVPLWCLIGLLTWFVLRL